MAPIRTLRKATVGLLALGLISVAGIARAASPTVTGLDPERGTPGIPVLISGSGFISATKVTFNDSNADFTIDSDRQITATVPRGSLTGPVTVTTPDGSASSPENFVVQPNIVLILTDDQRYDELSMPNVRSALMEKGVTFSNGFVVNPLCCPSRATILTGKYSHGTDIYSNVPPHGGFATFTNAGEDSSTIATWLDDAGYYTGLFGKYLNGYSVKRASYIPPGWNQWGALTLTGSEGGEHVGGYYDYSMSVNGTLQSYGDAPSDYSTTVLGNDAVSFVQNAPTDRPFFLFFAPRAPHGPATPPNRYKSSFQNLQPLRPPSYNEADVSDKPAYIRALAPLDPTQLAAQDALRLHQYQSLLRVDDYVGSIVDELRKSGRLRDTLIVFASDNGLTFAEHRWPGKLVPYEESIRVPIIARYDALAGQPGRVDNHFVLNLDFAPTLAAAAGVAAPGAEGVSFLPLLQHHPAGWRTGFLIEHADFKTPQVPTYCAVRNQRYIYVKYQTGEEELYDLLVDPYELQNIANEPKMASTKARLYARMLQLCSPPPPGYTP